MKKSLLSVLLIFCISIFVNSQTTFSWRNDQNPTSGQWNVSNYWWNGSGAALPGGAEILFLDGSVGTTMTNDLPSTNRYRITFGASGNSRTVNGSTTNVFYDFSNNIPAVYNASGNTQTINFPLQIGNTSSSTSPAYGIELNASSGNLTFGTSATISAQNNTGTKVLVLRASGGGSGTVTLNGVVSNGSGTMSISKIETNTAIMGALNTYTGATAITGGTLRANIAQSGSAGAFGNNSTITVSSGCTLDLNGFNATVASVSETGSSNGGSVTLGSGTLTISGGWSGTRYQNSITGTGGVTKQGTGILSLYGTQSFSGATVVSGGELSSAVAMSSTSYTVNGGTFRTAAANIVPTSSNFDLSSGTLTFDNSQTINNLTVSGGTLNVAAGQTLTVNGTLTINGSTTITLNSTGKIVYGASGKLVINTALTTNNDIWPVTGSEQPKDVTIGANVTLHTAKTISGLLTISSGFSFDLGVNQLSGSTITTSGTGTLLTQNTGSTPVPTGRTWSMLVSYNANSAQTISTGTYSGGLTASNSSIATKTLGGDATISGVLTLSTSKIALNGNTLTLNGTVSGMDATNSFIGSTSSKLSITSTGNVGIIYFDQTTSADASSTTGTNALQNLLVSGSGGSVTLGNKLNLFERLSVSGGTLNTGDALVLRSVAGSSSNNTAYVDQVGGTINGQVTIERYIHKQSQGWRAITAPISYNGISQGYVSGNWQSNFGYSGNYGTRITGPSATNGIDDVTISASLMTYNSSTGAWNKISNTTTETMAGSNGNADNKSFFLFVRGDRTVTPNGYNPNAFVATTLAAKGKLQTGTQTFTYGGAANKAWLVGNPYTCPIDMSTVTFNGSIPNFVYVWDPNRPSSYSGVTGAYVTFDRTSWGAPTAGSTTKYFQSGECFFVVPTSASGVSVVFNESNKNTSNQNNQTAGSGNGLSDEFNIKLSYIKTDGSKAEIDGIRAKFGANYSAAVDVDDAYKWSSADIENMSLTRNNANLVIEARPHITSTDSLFLNITNLSIGSNYEFKLNPINFDASVSSCKLVDKFLNTETPVSLTNTTLVSFNVTSVSGSNASNRFYVVFNATGNLPTSNSLTVKAYKQSNNNIKIDWEAIAENNVKTYTVEKSTDAVSFSKLSEATAKNGNTTNTYSIIDNNPVIGVNYYRIQSVQTNNNKAYSTIVRVEMSAKGVKSITVYPNPVKGNSNTIGLQMSNLTSGNYTAVLYNAAGQQVWMNTMNHNGSNGSVSLQLNKTLASGNYQLQLTDSKGNSYKQTVLVVE